MDGNGTQGTECTFREKDIVQSFTKYSGKCARIDSELITADKQTVQTVEDIWECKSLCTDSCTPSECPCKAYQFNPTDLTCNTFTETERMIGDTTPKYDCYIEDTPYDSLQFKLMKGKCQRLDGLGTTQITVEGTVFDRDACLALCVDSDACTAAQYNTITQACITWQDTTTIIAEGTPS